MLHVKNLNISFLTENGTTQVVHDINFELNKNEILGIVGEIIRRSSRAGMGILCASGLFPGWRPALVSGSCWRVRCKNVSRNQRPAEIFDTANNQRPTSRKEDAGVRSGFHELIGFTHGRQPPSD